MSEKSIGSTTLRKGSGVEVVTRAAVVMLVATLLVRVLSLLKEVVIASRFGVGVEMDAYNAAAAIPMLLIAVMIPAISGAVIPLLSNIELRCGRNSSAARRAWATILVGSALALMLATVLLISGSALLGTTLNLLALALGGSVETDSALPLARTLLIILAPMVLFQGMAATATCLFHIHKRFLLPAVATSVFPLTIIVALLIHPAPEVEWMAWAAILGSVLVTATLLPYCRRHAALFSKPDGELLRRFSRLLLPLIIVMIFAHLSECLIYLMGFTVSAGGASSLGYAHRLVDMPTMLIGVSFTAAVFPFFSDTIAEGRMKKLAGLYQHTLGQLIILMVPVTVGWFVFGRQVLISIYEQGVFDETATEMTLTPLLMFALGGTFKTIMFLEGRLFMALGMIRTLVLFGLGHLLLNISLAVFLGRSIGYSGLALSISAAYCVVSLALFLLSVRCLSPHLRPRSLMLTAGRALAAAATAGTLTWWLLILVPAADGLAGIWRLTAGGTLYCAVYLLIGWLVGINLRDFSIRKNI